MSGGFLGVLFTKACELFMPQRGTLQRRAGVHLRPLLYFVILFHTVFTVLMLVYPIVVKTREYDGVYIGIAVLTMMHWVVLKGECIVGWLEKRLFYEEYYMGQAPRQAWFMDAFPPWVGLALLMIIIIGMYASFTFVMCRNLNLNLSSGYSRTMQALALGELELNFGSLLQVCITGKS